MQQDPVPNKDLLNLFLTGGKGDAGHLMVQRATYFRKVNVLFSIFFLSILVALFMMKLLFKPKEDDPDANFDEDDVDFKQRWKKLIMLTLYFILAIILCYFFLLMFVMLYYMAKAGADNDDPIAAGMKAAKEALWEYTDSATGERICLYEYYMLIIIVLVLLYVFYIIYTLSVKGYFKNIFYENVDKKNLEGEEPSQPTKYIHRYAVYVVLMMLFALMLLNYMKMSEFTAVFLYNILIISFYVLLTVNIIRFNLQGNIIKFWIWVALFFILVIIYQYPLKAMGSYVK